MDDLLAKLVWACTLAVALAPTSAVADDASDQYTVAAGHYARGRWQLAVDEFDQFLQHHADHERAAQATFFSAEALVQLGQFAQARDRFQSYLDRFPTGRYAREALFRVGEAGYLDTDPSDADKPLEHFLAAYPDDDLIAYVLPYLGDLALAARDYDAATAYYTSGMARFPNGPLVDECRYGLARSLQERGELRPAQRLFRQLAADSQHRLSADAQFQLAAIDYSRGDYGQAEQSLATFIERWPDSPHRAKAQLARGWTLFQLKRYDDAAKVFDALAAVESIATEALYWRALVYKAQEQWSIAAHTLEPLIATTNDDAQRQAFLFHRADALRHDGQSEAAAALFDEVIVQDPAGNWADDAQLGKLHIAAAAARYDDVDRLSAEFHQAYPASELRREVVQLAVRSLLDRKLYEQAVLQLEPFVAQAPAPGDVPTERYLLALAHLGIDQFAEAEAALAPLQEIEAHELASNIELARATALVGQKRYAEALVSLSRCWQRQPNDDAAARCLGQWAVCLAHTENYDEAQQRYQQLVDGYPDHSVVTPTTLHLAEAAYAAGQRRWSAELFARLDRDGQQAEVAAQGISGVAWNLFKQGALIEAAAKFAELLDRYPAQPVAAEAALARGQILERLDQSDAALAMYHQVIEQHSNRPQLPAALLHAARLHERLQQRADSLRFYARLAADHPELPEADAVLYEWAWVLREAGQSADAEQVFARLKQEHPTSRFAPEATYRLAEAAFNARQLDQADSLLQELLSLQPHLAVRQHGFYLQGQLAAHRQRWDHVATPMQSLLDEFPNGQLAFLAKYWIAEAEYRQANYKVAAEKLDALIAQFPQPPEPWMAIILLRRAQTHGQLDHWHEARALAERIPEQFPNFDQQYEADYLLGRCLANQAEFEQARSAYRRVIASPAGGATETAAMAQWMIGETYFHQKELATAVREYLRVEVLYAYPTWQAAALLQAGKCYERLENWQQAAQSYSRVVREFNETPFADEAARRLRTAEARASTHKS